MLVGNLLPRRHFFHAAKSARMNARVPGRYFAGINRRALRHASLNSLASAFIDVELDHERREFFRALVVGVRDRSGIFNVVNDPVDTNPREPSVNLFHSGELPLN